MIARLIEIKTTEPLNKVETTLIRDVIASGGLLIYPTDTIYGLGCDAFIKSAVAKVSALKGRREGHPFSVHLGSVGEIERFALINLAQKEIIKKILPGPYTVLLRASSGAPAPCISSEGKIGIRCPKSTSFSKIYAANSRPLVGTSVNTTGQAPLNDPEQIIEKFSNSVNLIILTSEPMSLESSAVIDLTSDPPRALRGRLPDLHLL